MAAISLSINRGAIDFDPSNFTVGTLAPNANDVEIRYNTTDQQSATIPRKDVIVMLYAMIRALESDALFATPLGL